MSNPSNRPDGTPNGPGWYILSTVGGQMSATQSGTGDLSAAYAKSAADFQKRYGVPPMTDTPYKTQAEAEQAIKDNFAPHGSTQAKASQASSAITSALSPLTSISGFLGRLSSANMWLRVGEVLLGLVLVAVGVAKMTNTLPIATKVAKTAGAVALA